MVVVTTVQPYLRAACTAKPPQPVPISTTDIPGASPELAADQIQLVQRRLFERRVRAREDGAGVHHRRVEKRGEELVAEIVVGGDVAPAAGTVVAPQPVGQAIGQSAAGGPRRPPAVRTSPCCGPSRAAAWSGPRCATARRRRPRRRRCRRPRAPGARSRDPALRARRSGSGRRCRRTAAARRPRPARAARRGSRPAAVARHAGPADRRRLRCAAGGRGAPGSPRAATRALRPPVPGSVLPPRDTRVWRPSSSDRDGDRRASS